MTDDRHCKLCKELIPKVALYAMNILAIEHGYCSWFCLSMKEGHKKAMAIIEKERIRRKAVREPESRQKMHEKPQERRSRQD